MWCGTTQRGRERLRSDSDCSAYEEEYRIVVVGAKGVGKTAICQLFVGGKEEQNSCDRLVVQRSAKFRRAEFCTWDTVDGQICCMRLSELRLPTLTSQVDSDDPILKSLTQSADGFLLIYSVTDTEGFWATSGFHELILDLRHHTDTPLVYIGNKTDTVKGRLVTSSEGRDVAFNLGASFYEISAKAEPHGIKCVFHDVVRQVRSVRSQVRLQEQTCNRVRGLIHRLSLKSKRRRSKSRSRLKLTSSEHVQNESRGS